MKLEETIQLMAKYAVVKVKTAEFEVELSPLGFKLSSEIAKGAFANGAGEGRCKCSHPLTMHTADGLCLGGCGEDACELMREEGASPS